MYPALAVYSYDHLAAKRLRDLAREEINHENALRAGKRYCESMPDIFPGVTFDEAEVIQGIKEVKSYIDSLKTVNLPFTNHLNKLLKFEMRFETIRLGASSKGADPTLKYLFVGLSKEVNAHVIILKAIIESYSEE